MSSDVYDIRKNLFGHWYIVHPTDEFLAWSGSRWVSHYKGVPTGDTQVSNFKTPSDLHRYALENLERIKNGTTTWATNSAEGESTEQ